MEQRAFEINTPTVVHDTIDGEVLVIHNKTGVYYSLESVAADVWVAIDAGCDEAGIADVLAARYGRGADDVRADVSRFLDQLQDAELVRAGTRGDAAVALAGEPGEYTAPELHSYTDMQDLLLFDPIHEVDPAGWPNVTGDEDPAAG